MMQGLLATAGLVLGLAAGAIKDNACRSSAPPPSYGVVCTAENCFGPGNNCAVYHGYFDWGGSFGSRYVEYCLCNSAEDGAPPDPCCQVFSLVDSSSGIPYGSKAGGECGIPGCANGTICTYLMYGSAECLPVRGH